MKYRREESFRYTFETPITGTFKLLIPNNDKVEQTSEAPVEIIDISPGGLCFSTSLDIPLESKEFLLEVHFTLTNENIVLIGNIVWKRPFGVGFTYGFEAVKDDKTEQQITKSLKKFIQEKR